ncbi:MAG: glycerol-3-phosphate 1-O-acyltransferase PlsY [Bacteroidota bacterium]
MLTALNIFALLVAYLIGSIPSAVWIGKYFYGVDVREHGSGNAGATNTFRVLGKAAGLPVLIIDILKGLFAVKLANLAVTDSMSRGDFIELKLALGIAALIGHIFPVLASFRGGKGIATLLGISLAIDTESALFSVAVFLLVFLLTNYVSLSSIIASFAFPFSLIFVFPATISSQILFGFFTCVVVLITHQKNIERLLRRQETKISLRKKSSSGHLAEDTSD